MIKVVIVLSSLIIGFLIAFIITGLSDPSSLFLGIGLSVCVIISYAILFFLIAGILTIPISRKKEYKYSKFYRRLFYHYCHFTLKLFGTKVTTTNLDKLPKEECIIVCNHLSNFDTFVIDCLLQDRILVFVSKKSLFKIPWFGKMIHRINYLSMLRNDPRKDVEELNRGVKLINEENYSIGIFPEGTRNFSDEPLLPFKNGYQYLANRTKKPIVVMAIQGTNDIKNNLLFKKHPVKLDLIEVIDYDDYSKLSHLELSERISNEIISCISK